MGAGIGQLGLGFELMGLPSYVVAESGGCLLTIKAQPRARSTAFAGMHGGALKIRIASPPVEGAANEALVEFLADFLGCGRRQVAVARGATSPHKVVRITGMDAATVTAKLVAAGVGD